MKQGELFPPQAAGPDPDPAPEPAEAPVRSPAPPVESAPPGDAAHRERAATVFDRPLLLEAGAGTGKTATLVARVVHWCLGPGWELEAGEDDAERVAARVLRGVCAITFTEAAAAEMSARVGQALARIQTAAAGGEPLRGLPSGLVVAALPPVGALAERARALRAALDQLGVSTIHAFCRRLLAAHPLEVGLDPAFEVDATFRGTELVVREVLEEYLREAWSEPLDEDLIALARHGIGPPEIEATVVELIDKGARAADFEPDPFDDDTCARLSAELREAHAALLEVIDPLRGSRHNTHHAVDALDATTEGLAVPCRAPRGQLDADMELVAGAWAADGAALDRLHIWSKDKLIGAERKALGDGASELVRRAERFERALEPFVELEPERLERSRRVVGTVLAEVEEELRRRGIATFSDLLVQARRLLCEHPRIAARERGRVRQLLVDEFQDTDSVQCEIVAALGLDGEPDQRPGLFLVGDPKQSIFAWRNADLLAYHDFAERVVAAGGERLELRTNFRSVRAVLDEVERSLAPVMHFQRGVQPPFAALEPGRPDADAPRPEGDGPAVEFWVSWPRGGDGAIECGVPRGKGRSYEAEARALAADVLARRPRAASWKAFAVVFRSFTEIEPYLQELRARGIPYEVQSDRKYYQRREVIDATALVRAALDPSDHLALVALLRSPMVGTPDAALLPLWEEGLPGALTGLTWADEPRLAEVEALVARAAARVPAGIPGLDQLAGWEASLVAALRSLAQLRGSFADEPVDRWVERLRAAFLPEAVEAARFLGAFRLANLERFFRELVAALEERAGDVRSILRTLRASLARDDRSEASRPADSGQDAVQVLTIHGSKGLQFEHVYLAQMHKEPRAGGDDATEFDRRGERGAYVLFRSPSPAWFEATHRRKEAEAAERVRLLYVAATRAENRLVLVGGWQPGAEPKPWRRGRTFADLLAARSGASAAVTALAARAAQGKGEPLVDEHGAAWIVTDWIAEREGAAARAEVLAPPALPSAASIEREWRELAEQRQAAGVRMSRPFHRAASEEAHVDLAELRAGRSFQGAERAGPALGRAAAQAAGTAVHRVLEELDLGADLGPELERLGARLEGWIAELAPARDVPAALERARELLERARTGGLLERLRGLGQAVVARELPILLEPGAEGEAPVGFVSGAVDLLYRSPETGELVVADYKTDGVEGDELVARAASYAPQGRAYVAAVQQALGLEHPPRFELWFLHAGSVEVV